MFAAEVRYRAADDLSFLLPADDTVKLAGSGIRGQGSGIKIQERLAG
jgi:hypothetical protein